MKGLEACSCVHTYIHTGKHEDACMYADILCMCMCMCMEPNLSSVLRKVGAD
jgi:hypothetical protein